MLPRILSRLLNRRQKPESECYWSPENQNEEVLSKYPKIPGYPHLFVLDKNGKLIHSQDTSELEDGRKSYNLEKFTAFLKEWAAPER
jgi:hypothetical protein